LCLRSLSRVKLPVFRSVVFKSSLGMPACSGNLLANIVLDPVGEDNSKHYLKHFDGFRGGDSAIESMAKQGSRFDRQFPTADRFCSVARSDTLINRLLRSSKWHVYIGKCIGWLGPKGWKCSRCTCEMSATTPRIIRKRITSARVAVEPWTQSSRKAVLEKNAQPTTPVFSVKSHAQFARKSTALTNRR